MKRHTFKVGDKVRVPQWATLHKRYNIGVITYRNGADILVTLNYKNIIWHLYVSEVELI